METGITHLVLRREHGDLETAMPKVKAWGYDGLEVLLTDDGDIRPGASEADCSRVRRLAAANGLSLQSMCISVGDRGEMVSGSEANADKFRATTAAAVDACLKLGVDNVLIIPGGVTAQVPYDVCYDRALAGLKSLRPVADKGVNLAVEYVWNNMFLSPLELRACLDEVDHPHIGFYMDTGNVMAYGFAEQWIRILGRHITKVHTKNFKRRPAWQWPNLLSDGDADWSAIMAALTEIGYDGPLISEMSGTPEQHAENARFTKALYGG